MYIRLKEPTPHSDVICSPADHLFSPTTSSSSSSSSPPLPFPSPVTVLETMSWTQKTFSLPSLSRGSHLVTKQVLQALSPELQSYRVGLVHLFLQHTSAALCLNENADPDVRADMSDALDRVVPEGEELYRHDCEGKDDMPAHVKAALVGSGVTVPIVDGRLGLGMWQGIWFMEFREGGHTRRVVATIQGEKKG